MINKKFVKKKVCFVLASVESGGTERYVLRFLEHYKDEIDATIICKSGKLGVLEANFNQLGATILPIKTGFINIVAWIKIYRKLSIIRYDSIVDFTGNFAGIYMMLGSFVGINKRITFYRQSSNHFRETNFKLQYNNWVKSLVYKYSTNILSNTKFAFKFFFPNESKLDNRFGVIPNGIDATKFLNIKEDKLNLRKYLCIDKDKFIIGHVGRFDKSKNHETILKIAKTLNTKFDNFEFLFCGKGTNNDNFRELVKKKGLENKVYLLGYREDIPKVLKSLDFFLFPSITEGQPNSLIEAMISGLPFVTSNIEPIKESIPKYVNNYLIDANDSKRASEIIINYYQNQNLQPFLNSKKWAISQYDSEKQFHKFHKLL